MFYKVLCFFFCLYSFNLFGQTQKGSYVLGGTINVHYQIEQKYFHLAAIPNIGHFFIDNLAVGVDLVTAWSRQKNTFDEQLEYVSIGATPFVRYYSQLNWKGITPFVEMRYGYEYTRFANLTKEEVGKFYQPNWGGALGIAYFLNPNCALNLIFDYQQSRLKNTIEVMAENKTWSTQIGVEVFLNRVK